MNRAKAVVLIALLMPLMAFTSENYVAQQLAWCRYFTHRDSYKANPAIQLAGWYTDVPQEYENYVAQLHEDWLRAHAAGISLVYSCMQKKQCKDLKGFQDCVASSENVQVADQVEEVLCPFFADGREEYLSDNAQETITNWYNSMQSLQQSEPQQKSRIEASL